jgi:hypothetical protein
MKFLIFFSIFVRHFRPPGSGSNPDPKHCLPTNFHGREEIENFVTSLVPVFELRLLQAAQGGVLMGQFVLPDGDLRLQLFQALVGLHQLAVSDSL